MYTEFLLTSTCKIPSFDALPAGEVGAEDVEGLSEVHVTKGGVCGEGRGTLPLLLLPPRRSR